MKTKVLILAAVSCMIMVACNSNNPDNLHNQQMENQLAAFFDGIGQIVSSETQQDGSVVMKDDKNNIIIQDKDGNITVTTANGEIIRMDHTIREDATAPHDKWYNSTWETADYNVPIGGEYQSGMPDFVTRLIDMGFHVDQQEITNETPKVEQEQRTHFELRLFNTVCALRQNENTIKCTYTETLSYLKITLSPEEIGDGELRYELVIEGDYAYLQEKYYRFDDETGQYVLDYSRDIDRMFNLDENHSITLSGGFEKKDYKEEIVSSKTQTTMYNYRRLDETQLAASNATESYIVKEDTSGEVPELEVYNLKGEKIVCLQLHSL